MFSPVNLSMFTVYWYALCMVIFTWYIYSHSITLCVCLSVLTECMITIACDYDYTEFIAFMPVFTKCGYKNIAYTQGSHDIHGDIII